MDVIVIPDGAPICCCGEAVKPPSGCVGCAELANTTLYLQIHRYGGDWSDCGSGQWEDGEVVEMLYQGVGGPAEAICENSHFWQGTTACGDTLTICCNPDNDIYSPGGDIGIVWSFWWCDPVNEYNTQSTCTDGRWELGDYGIGGGVACCCIPGTFLTTIYRDNPP